MLALHLDMQLGVVEEVEPGALALVEQEVVAVAADRQEAHEPAELNSALTIFSFRCATLAGR